MHEMVPPRERGTFAALANPHVIEHLQRLGITAIELLPVHAFMQDRFLVERKLRNWKDWVRFVGEKAKVVLREPIAVAATPAVNPPKHLEPMKHFEGVIARADDQGHTVTVELSGGAEVTFPVEQVDRANLKFEW